MDLQGTLSLPSNLGSNGTLSDAYVKVARISLNKETAVADIEVRPSKDVGAVAVLQHGFSYDISAGAPNAIAQAYASMKLTSRFSQFADV